jgi:hypothetical protein
MNLHLDFAVNKNKKMAAPAHTAIKMKPPLHSTIKRENGNFSIH